MKSSQYENEISKINRVRREISHTCDGPVTDFVLMSRAMKCVQGGEDASIVANALHEELSVRGMLTDGDIEHLETVLNRGE